MAERIDIVVNLRGDNRARRGILRLGTASRTASRGLRELRGLLGGLSAAILLRELTQISDQITRFDNRLNLLTGSQSATNDLFVELTRVATNTRSSIEDTVELFSRFQRSTQQLNLSNQELLDLTTGINQAFRIYGNTAQEASAATIQFAQGLASGALRGEELRSVLEQAPRLAQAIAAGLTEIEALGEGVQITIGDFRELGAQGLLTAELITEALQTQLGALDEEFSQTTATIGEGFQNIADAFLVLARDLGLGVEVGRPFAQILFDIGEAIRNGADNVRPFLQGIQSLAIALRDAFDAATIILLPITSFIGFLIDGLVVINNFISGLVGFDVALTILAGAALGLAAAFAPVTLTVVAVGTALALLGAELNRVSEETQALVDATSTVTETTRQYTDENRILQNTIAQGNVASREQAENLIVEARARIQNIATLRDEALAQREALVQRFNILRAQNDAIQARPLAFIDLVGALEGRRLAQEAELIGEAVAALDDNLKELGAGSRDAETAIAALENRIAENNFGRSAGSASDALDELARRKREAAREARALETAQRNLQKSIQDLTLDADALRFGAGTGANNLRETERLLERLNSLEREANRIGADTTRIAQERARIQGFADSARQQTLEDIITQTIRERNELSLSNAELETRNALRSAGLNINDLDPARVAALTEENRQLAEGNERRRERLALETRQRELLEGLGRNPEQEQLLGDASTLQNAITGGNLNTDQLTDAEERLTGIRDRLRELRLEAGEGSFLDGFTQQLREFSEEGENVFQSFGNTVGEVATGALSQLSDGIANAIVNGESLGETFRNIARTVLTQLISSFIQLGIQFLINQALAQTSIAAATGAAVAAGTATAAAYAPAAALASLASFGANAAPAAAGIATVSALTRALSVIGLRDGGIVSGPGGPRDDRVPAMLSNGEFVVNAAATRENRSLLEAINRGGRIDAGVPAGTVNNVTMNIATNDADSFGRSRREVTRAQRRALG